MKKWIGALCCVLLLTGCGAEEGFLVPEEEEIPWMIGAGTEFDKLKEWFEPEYGLEIISTPAAAMDAAACYFHGLGYRQEEAYEDFRMQHVFYDEVDRFYVVSMWRDGDDSFRWNIAIKPDGEVLCIWTEGGEA